MKKRTRLMISMILVLTLLVTTLSVINADGTSTIQTFDLLAGKNINIGSVNVWEDTDNLYVQYLITENDWEITETHLHIAANLGDIPKTAKGNPIPGQFAYSQNHDPAVDNYTYAISLADLGSIGENLVIAAHAAVQHWGTQTVYDEKSTTITEDYKPEIDWTRSSEDNVFSTEGYGGKWTYDGVIGKFNSMDATVWDSGAYRGLDPTTPEYASWKYAYNDGGSYGGCSDLRLFRGEFEIPEDYTVNSAALGTSLAPDNIPINDNIYIYVNEELQFWGGTRANGIIHGGREGREAIGYGSGMYPETDDWYIPGSFPSIDNLNPGETNTIEVFAEENERWGGMGKLDLTLNCTYIETELVPREEPCIDQTESAWGAGKRISPKGNWGTYFEYTLAEPSWILVETVTVPSNGDIVYSDELKSDITYKLETSGTYRFANWDEAGIADAKYSYRKPGYIPTGYPQDEGPQWVDGADLKTKGGLQIRVNGAYADWDGDYNDDHKYTKEIVSDGLEISFKILDDIYGDNSGDLYVTIYRWGY